MLMVSSYESDVIPTTICYLNKVKKNGQKQKVVLLTLFIYITLLNWCVNNKNWGICFHIV